MSGADRLVALWSHNEEQIIHFHSRLRLILKELLLVCFWDVNHRHIPLVQFSISKN